MTFKSEAEPEHASCVGVTGVDEVYTAELKCSSTAPLSVAFAAAVRALTLHHSARIWMNRTVLTPLTLWHLQVALTVANCVNFHALMNARPKQLRFANFLLTSAAILMSILATFYGLCAPVLPALLS